MIFTQQCEMYQYAPGQTNLLLSKLFFFFLAKPSSLSGRNPHSFCYCTFSANPIHISKALSSFLYFLPGQQAVALNGIVGLEIMWVLLKATIFYFVFFCLPFLFLLYTTKIIIHQNPVIWFMCFIPKNIATKLAHIVKETRHLWVFSYFLYHQGQQLEK